MKSPLVLLLTLLVLCAPATHADETPLVTLTAADDARIAAMLAPDQAKLDAIFSADLHYAHSSGAIDTKTSFLDILVSGKNRLTAFDAVTRKELWQYGEGEGPFNGEIVVSPVAASKLVAITRLSKNSLLMPLF